MSQQKRLVQRVKAQSHRIAKSMGFKELGNRGTSITRKYLAGKIRQARSTRV